MIQVKVLVDQLWIIIQSAINSQNAMQKDTKNVVIGTIYLEVLVDY